MRGGRDRVAPQQESLRAGPNSMHHAVAAIFPQQVAITVAQEAAGTAAEFHQSRPFLAWFGPFQFADFRLMIGHAEMLRPILRRNFHRHAGGQRQIDHGLVHAFGMHVDFHLAPAFRHAFEYCFPKIVAPLGDSALSVDAKRDAADGRAGFQQS